MVPRYNIPLDEERDLALRRLQRICDNDFISVLDFWNNPLRIFAAHELAAIIDPAMTTKMTVQVNAHGLKLSGVNSQFYDHTYIRTFTV